MPEYVIKLLKYNVDIKNLPNYIVDSVTEENMKGLPVPDVTMLVASASMEQEIECLTKLNPSMEFVIYTLDFALAASNLAFTLSLTIWVTLLMVTWNVA